VQTRSKGKRGFVLLPRRWVEELNFAWAARFRRLASDYEKLATTHGAFHFLVVACHMIARLYRLLA
jgi:transposase